MTIKTKEREPREVQVDTSEFADISLAYAVHVHKGQGLTAETSGILTGAWQTDKEHAYVAVSRAREQTQIYVAREDLGEQGMDTGAIERLADRMQRSRAQEATIAKNTIEPNQLQPERGQRRERQRPRNHERGGPQRAPAPQRPSDREEQQAPTPQHCPDRDSQRPLPRGRPQDLDDDVPPREQPDRSGEERSQSAASAPAPQTHPSNGPAPIDIHQANPGDVKVSVRDLGSIKLAYSQAYDLQAHTGQQTYALFGAWQTDKEQGFVAVTQTQERTEVHMTTEDRGERDIETELTDRIGAVIEQSQAQEPPTADREASTPEPDREREPDHPAQLEPADRDPYIDQAIQEAQDRQQAWESGIDQDRDNDHGLGIE